MSFTYHHTEEAKQKIKEASIATWSKEENRKKLSEQVKKSYTDELRELRSKRFKELWADPEYRAKLLEKRQAHYTKEYREEQSRRMKEIRKKDPTISDRQSASIKKTMASPEYREKRRRLSKEIANRPEVKEATSKHSKEWWDNVSDEQRSKRASKIAKTTKDTVIERKVCKQLSEYKVDYIQQVSLFGGRYFLDIVLPKYNIAIECNGDYWHSLPDRVERDKRLAEDIKKTPYTLITIWEHDIKAKDFDVMMYVTDFLDNLKENGGA